VSSTSVYRQREREDRTTGLARLDPQAPAMCFDNRAANGQADAQPAGLCAVKGIEHPIEIRGIQAWPAISNRNEDSFGVGSVGANSQLPLFLPQAAHGFDCVRDEVQDHLLQLYAIGVNER
jgi:hypothetical protein